MPRTGGGDDIVRDISLLYELALSIGQSLDLEECCAGFVDTLMARKNLDVISVWIRSDSLETGAAKTGIQLLYGTPEFRIRDRELAADHPLCRAIESADPLAVREDDSQFATIVTERGVNGGVYGLIPLQSFGILKLYSTKATALLGPRDLVQLRGVAEKFAVSLQGALAHSRLVGEIEERRRAEQALVESEDRFRRLAENAPDMIFRYRLQPTREFEYVNPAATTITGYRTDEFYERPDFLIDLVAPEDQRKMRDLLISPESSDPLVWLRWRKADSSTVWVSQRLAPITAADGTTIAVEGIVRDVTERQKAQEALERANDQLAGWVSELEQRNQEISILSELGDLLQSCKDSPEAFEVVSQIAPRLFPNTSGSLAMISPSRTMVETAARWAGVTGPAPVFALDECWALRRGRAHVVTAETAGLRCAHARSSTASSTVCIPMMAQGEALGILHVAYSETVPGESGLRLLNTTAEQIGLALSNLVMRESLRLQSIRDPLTGLFNRRYLEETIERELRRTERAAKSLGVMMIDVDHFKQFNDTFGHAAGDAVLREIGTVMRVEFRGEDIACRYGGEEFILVLPEIAPDAVAQRAEQFRKAIKQLTVRHQNQTLGTVTVSIGAACFPEHGKSSEQLIRAADAALYRAKQTGRDRVVVANRLESDESGYDVFGSRRLA